MKNLLLLITKYGSTIVFVILELICFYLIINFNQSQKEIWAHSANLFAGKANDRVQFVNEFFKLKEVNDSLLNENSKLLETIINYRVTSKENNFQEFETQDTNLLEYKFIPAYIIGKTNNLRNNHITLNKGIKDSIKIGMGVISKNGIVGIVKNVSENYCQVMTIIHSQSKVSASIQSNNFHGTLTWPGGDPLELKMISLPRHVDIALGDTIITSGYSTVFPFGIPVGKITNHELESGSNTYSATVELFNDITKLNYVYVLNSVNQEEKELIELEE